MLEIATLVLGVGFVLAFAALPRLLLERRESTATLSWLFAILFLPYLGLFTFWFFGARRIRRMERRKARADGRLAGGRELVSIRTARFARPAGPPGEYGVLETAMRLSERIGSSPPTTGNRVDLLLDGDATFSSIEAAVEAARDHVHLEYYVFRPDRTGTRLRDLLARRVRQGVEVRLLYDHAGSLSLGAEFLAPLVAAGGEIGVFLPVGRLSRRFNVSFRNHRKVVVVDGSVGFTGGINIGDDYLAGGRRSRRWRDTHARIAGPAVLWLQEVFAEDWYFATGKDLHQERYFPAPDPAGDQLVQVLASGPDRRWEIIHRILITAIGQAERTVLITTPYLVPDQAMQVALENAALRGVDVRILLPGRSDHRILDYTARSFFPELLGAGVRLFEYGPGIMHAKTAVIDDVWSTVGSANMDVRSFRFNFEANLVVYGAEFAGRLNDVIRRDLDQAHEVSPTRHKRTAYRERLIEGACRLLAPVL